MPVDVVLTGRGSTGPVTSYTYDFGDGTVQSDDVTGPAGIPDVTHTYTTAGARHATLTVTDGYGRPAFDHVTITNRCRPRLPPATTRP